MMRRSKYEAVSRAPLNSSAFSALLMPTLEPRFAGFTKQGYPRESSISSIRVSLSLSHCHLVREIHLTCGRSWWAKIFFIVGLSMPAALPSTPLPT
jgi:hypothetical protein